MKNKTKINKYILCFTDNFYAYSEECIEQLKRYYLTDSEAKILNYALSLNHIGKQYIKI